MMLEFRYVGGIIIGFLFLTACDYGNVIEIQQKSEYYKFYVDSVIKIKPIKSYSNWDKISKKHDSLKKEVLLASKDLKKDDAINKLIIKSSHTFDTFKLNSIKSYNASNANDSIKSLQKKIFKFTPLDLQFKALNETNILRAFKNLNAYLVENNKYLTKTNWSNIYKLYQALDARKKILKTQISNSDILEINKIQPKMYALIKLNTIF